MYEGEGRHLSGYSGDKWVGRYHGKMNHVFLFSMFSNCSMEMQGDKQRVFNTRTGMIKIAITNICHLSLCAWRGVEQFTCTLCFNLTYHSESRSILSPIQTEEGTELRGESR